MPVKLTRKQLQAMPREKRMYWLRRISNQSPWRVKDWQIPFYSVGGQQLHVQIMRGIPMFLRDLYVKEIT